jgi:hypothetical protein
MLYEQHTRLFRPSEFITYAAIEFSYTNFLFAFYLRNIGRFFCIFPLYRYENGTSNLTNCSHVRVSLTQYNGVQEGYLITFKPQVQF